MDNTLHKKGIWNMVVIFVVMIMLLALTITLINIGVGLTSSISLADSMLDSTLGAVVSSQGI